MYWIEVDPKTHGSVVIYRDKASYKAALEGAQETCKYSYEPGMKMLHEAHGESFATLRD